MYILFFNCDIHFFIVCMYVFFIIMFYCVYGQMSEIKNYYYCCHTCVYITTIEGKLVETPAKDPEQLIYYYLRKFSFYRLLAQIGTICISLVCRIIHMFVLNSVQSLSSLLIDLVEQIFCLTG